MAFIPYHHHEYSIPEMVERASAFFQSMRSRRSVRTFSSRPVPDQVIQDCLQTAGTAPSGANHQPWHFAVITSPETKARLRQAAEQEEQAFYGGRAPGEWLDALAPLGTDAHKPFLEEAPVLIAIFAQNYALDDQEQKKKNYYVQESVGIATGFLIAALHQAGLCCLTHTPSPMKFLREILGRPEQERPFLLLVVGHPTDDAKVPDIARKPLAEFTSYH